MTLAVFPRHNDMTPSLAVVRLKQSPRPVYLRSRVPCLIISSCRTSSGQSAVGNGGLGQAPFSNGHNYDRHQSRVAHTWFWTRSLMRSMGAAAVFDTAAETPPTMSLSTPAYQTCSIRMIDSDTAVSPIGLPKSGGGRRSKGVLRKSIMNGCELSTCQLLSKDQDGESTTEHVRPWATLANNTRSQ